MKIQVYLVFKTFLEKVRVAKVIKGWRISWITFEVNTNVIFFQLLQIRQSLQASFEGCDIYTPRKPKGLASKALEEWRKHYPNSEETNKTIGKQANFVLRLPDIYWGFLQYIDFWSKILLFKDPDSL